MDGKQTDASLATAAVEPTDEALFRLFQAQRSEDAFARLVKQYYDLAYRLAFGYCGKSELAEEIAQEAFLKMARERSPRALDGYPSFKIWFSGVVLNAARHAIRTERRLMKRQKDPEVVALQHRTQQAREEPNDRPAVDGELRKVLTQALAEISDELRLPIILHYVEGMSQEEIGALSGVSQPTISKRLQKGLGMLRAKLADMGVAVTALSLPEYLRVADCLRAPPTMHAALENLVRKALAQPPASMRMAAGSGGTAWKAACFVVLLSVAGLGGYLALSAPVPQPAAAAPVASAPVPAPVLVPAAAPVVAANNGLPRVWRFETPEAMNAFEVQLNPWHWEPAAKTSPAGVTVAANTLARIPFVAPRQPFKVTLRFGELQSSIAFGCFYLDRNNIMERATWRKRRVLAPRSSHEVVFCCSGRWIVALEDGIPVLLQQYETDWPSANLGLSFGSARLVEVRAEHLVPSEAAALFAAPEKLIEQHALAPVIRERPAASAP